MSRYWYADARPMIKELDYDFKLFTSQNIEKLALDLKNLKFDAIVFGSNALNDVAIRNVVLSNEFKSSFGEFIKNGKGCLVLHQIRLAQDNFLLDFLSTTFSAIQPKIRGASERATDGNLFMAPMAKDHVCLRYPNLVDVEKLRDGCINFKSLKGLYWHYWDNINKNDWNVLLYDKEAGGRERPLIITSKDINPFRVVLCSLALDWQKQSEMFQNVLVFIVEGMHGIAILKEADTKSTGFDYYIESLRSQKCPLRVYNVDKELDDFTSRLSCGIHTMIIYGPDFHEEKLGPDTIAKMRQYINRGWVKLIRIKNDGDIPRFDIAGRERFALRLLYDIELKVQQELLSGYIDGSFWATIESLQVLNRMSPYVKSEYNADTLSNIIDMTRAHDRNGSYDEVLYATCALLWLRATYLGRDDRDTIKTRKWIKNYLRECDDREKIHAYRAMLMIKALDPNDEQLLKDELTGQLGHIDSTTEMDQISYLEMSIMLKNIDLTREFVRNLLKNPDDCWVDVEPTAAAISALLDARGMLINSNVQVDQGLIADIDSILFKQIKFIQDSMSTSSQHTYPWDNKANTSLKCVYAWLNFEKLINFPVRELTDVLKIHTVKENYYISHDTMYEMLDGLKYSNDELHREVEQKDSIIDRLKKNARKNRYIFVACIIVIYLLLSIAIASLLEISDKSIWGILSGVFINQWQVHLGLLTLIAAILAIEPIRIKINAWLQQSDR